MGLISEKVLEDVQASNDIVEVISGYIPLKKAGKDFKAVCPFHNEKTPSFMVNPQKQIFHCFGCGAGGDVISFVMKYERVEFVEAVKILAERAGIEVVTEEKKDKNASGKDRLYKLNEFAAGCYYDFLIKDPQAEPARAYLAKRGLNRKTAELFKIGYAPGSWDFLVNRAVKAGFTKKELIDSGLTILKSGSTDSYYDRFRERIVLPIFNVQGKAVGFSGRVLDNSLPKYVNTPETLIFNKGTLLYGLNMSKDDIVERGYAVICEGHIDFISLYQSGIRNACATQGTAFTQTHAKLLKRYTENVVAAFDGDSAGEAATLRSCEIFLSEGLSIKIAVLPKGYDPDSFVRKNGKEGFDKLINESKDFLDFKLDILKGKTDSASLIGKTRIASEMIETIAKFPSAVYASGYIKRLSENLDISEDALLIELRREQTKKKSVKREDDTPAESRIFPWEVDFARIALEDHRFLDAVGTIIFDDDLQDPNIKKILSAMVNLRDENRLNHASLINYFDDQELKDIVASLSFKNASADDKAALLKDYLANIKKRSISKDLSEISKRIAEAEKLNKDYSQLLKEVEAKKAQLNNLGKELSLFCENYE